MIKETYLVTRPRLASFLMERGIAGDSVPNPYDPDLKAWQFPATIEVFQVVATFYNEIGLPVPRTVKARLDRYQKGGKQA